MVDNLAVNATYLTWLNNYTRSDLTIVIHLKVTEGGKLLQPAVNPNLTLQHLEL